MELTQLYLKVLFDYRDGFLYWKVKRRAQSFVGDIAGGIKKDKKGKDRFKMTHVIRIDNKPYYTSRLIFLWHNGYLPPVVDHKDRNPLNNTIANLRPADNFKNARNRNSAFGSSSKYLGVGFYHGKWTATIFLNGKNKHLGTFYNEDLAALAYNEAAKEYYKEFANLNLISNNK